MNHHTPNDRPSWQTPDGPAPLTPEQLAAHWAATGQTPPPKPKRRASRVVLAVVGGCLLAIIGVVSCTAAMFDGAIGAAGNDVRPVISEPGPAVPRVKPTPPKPTEQAPSRLPRDGMLFVDKDVAPGAYVATVPDGAIGCYWARLKDTDGELESIIASKVATAGQIVLTIRKTDYAVEIRCDGAKWTAR